MSEIKDGGPAFPATEYNGLNNGEPGMTLRDYFAAKALSTAIGYASQDLSTWDFDDFAQHAYGIADAMLRARGES